MSLAGNYQVGMGDEMVEVGKVEQQVGTRDRLGVKVLQKGVAQSARRPGSRFPVP